MPGIPQALARKPPRPRRRVFADVTTCLAIVTTYGNHEKKRLASIAPMADDAVQQTPPLRRHFLLKELPSC